MLLHKEIIQALNQCEIVINSFNGLKSVINRNLLLNIQLLCVFLLDIKNITEQFLQSVRSLFYLMVKKGGLSKKVLASFVFCEPRPQPRRLTIRPWRNFGEKRLPITVCVQSLD